MKKLIQMIAQTLVDTPEQVSVEEIHGDKTTIFELRVAKSDLGKVIGKKGRTAEAIRVILAAASAKKNKRAVVEIVDSIDTKADIKPFKSKRPDEPLKVYHTNQTCMM